MFPNHISKMLQKIAVDEGFSDYEMKTSAGSQHGDNFLGEMTAVTISGTKLENNIAQKCDLQLLCKTQPSNKTRMRTMATPFTFKREIFVYTKLLPTFIRFQEEKGLSESEIFRSFPKVYACQADDDNELYVLIMEDLRPKKYKMYPKDVGFSLDHMTYILRELAKFHAISFAFKDQRPNEFKQFEEMKDTYGKVVIHSKLNVFTDDARRRAANVVTNPEHKKLVEEFHYKFIDAFDFCVESNELAIVTHGDLWCNNLLFKYDDQNKNVLESLCFIDWQACRYSSPVLDLLYLIFICTDKELRDQHYETLLKTYHQALCESIQKLGSDPTKLYTYDDLKSQLHKYGEYPLVCCPLMIQFCMAGPKDVNNLDDCIDKVLKGEKCDILNPFDEETKAKYSARINGFVTDLINYGYIGNK